MREPGLFALVNDMANIMRAEERNRCTEIRLQYTHFEVLHYLSQSTQNTNFPAAIAAYFGMTRGTLSQSLNVIENKGLIEKVKDVDDKRMVHIKLLEPGLLIIKKMNKNELISRASLIFKQQSQLQHADKLFAEMLKALQKASKPGFSIESHEQPVVRQRNHSIYEYVQQMAVLIRSEQRKRSTKLNVQLVHLQILEYLSRCNQFSDTPAAISEFLGKTRGTVSQSINLLKKNGWITKTQSSVDKRVFHIELQPRGLNILKQTNPNILLDKAEMILKKNSAHRPYYQAVAAALLALQQANPSNSFGICRSCQHFLKTTEAPVCLLMKQRLTPEESEKICQEYAVN